MRITSYDGDRLAILIPVTVTGGDPLNLATATLIEVFAQREGFASVAATSTVTDAAGGLLIAVFEPGSLAEGQHRLQCRVTAPGGPKTVLDAEILVFRSIPAPPA